MYKLVFKNYLTGLLILIFFIFTINFKSNLDASQLDNSTSGFYTKENKFNILEIKPTVLPCTINEKTILIKENSPYLINCNFTINSELIIEAGVVVLMDKNIKITVKGTLIINGNYADSVTIKPEIEGNSWDMIDIQGGTLKADFANILDGTIEGNNAHIEFAHVLLNSKNKDISAENYYCFLRGGYARFRYCHLESDSICEGFMLREQVGIVENCTFINVPDAIEFITVKDGIIRNNVIRNAGDDGIDMNNCYNMIVENNTIINVKDKGVSVGNEGIGISENILIKNNLLINCRLGVAVKDSSDALIINNTIHGSRFGIYLNEKFKGSGGGFAIANNNIISQTLFPVFADSLSSLFISYTICDSKLIDGENNKLADPMFIDSANKDFRLKSESPCINSGDPESSTDPDGSRNDIGAIPYGIPKFIPDLVINEINYTSSLDSLDKGSGDWIELYNNEKKTIDLSGMKLFIADSGEYIFPQGCIIDSGGYLVIYDNYSKFRNCFKNSENIYGSIEYNLPIDSCPIILMDVYGRTIDSVSYQSIDPWPNLSAFQNHSIELNSSELDNSLGENWHSSQDSGSPGSFNTPSTGVENSIQFLTSYDPEIILYPNPAIDYFDVQIKSKTNNLKSYKLIDLFGNIIIKKTFSVSNSNGNFRLYIENNKIPSGINILLLDFDNYTIFKKVWIIK